MDDLTQMFDSEDLDVRLESATMILEKVAAEEGYDLNDFTPEQLAQAMANVAGEGDVADSDEGEDGEGEGDEGGEYESEEGGGEEDGGEKEAGLTLGDVVLELQKRAADQEFDLTQLSPYEYEVELSKVAEELSDPELQEENQKWAQQVAEMDYLGRVTAMGFVDQLKIAADAKDEDDEDDEKKEEKKDKIASAKDKARAALQNFGGKARAFGAAAGKKEKSFHEGVGRRVLGTEKGDIAKGTATRRNAGRAITGGSAVGVGGGGYALKKHRDKKKEAALELARSTLLANGIDPDTGSKIAADAEVMDLAAAMLQEAGYEL